MFYAESVASHGSVFLCGCLRCAISPSDEQVRKTLTSFTVVIGIIGVLAYLQAMS